MIQAESLNLRLLKNAIRDVDSTWLKATNKEVKTDGSIEKINATILSVTFQVSSLLIVLPYMVAYQEWLLLPFQLNLLYD